MKFGLRPAEGNGRFQEAVEQAILAEQLGFDSVWFGEHYCSGRVLVAVSPGRAHYDIHPDGQRFLMMNMQGPEGPRPKINVVLNWFEELKRLVPTDN